METCDVLIVGGGPAGSSCARRLVAAGLDVIILDKSNFPRDKVCAGWITPAVIDELDIDLHDYRKTRICQPIRNFRTGLMQGPYLHHCYDDIVSYGIRRYEFDDYLLHRSGARLFLNEAANDIQRDGDRWLINKRFSASMLVGAGGYFCPVARFLGASIGKQEHSVSAKEIELEMSARQAENCTIEASTPELFFYPDLSGYGWVFRKDSFINIGIGREGSSKLSQSVIEFVELLQHLNKLPQDIELKFKGHAYLLYDYAIRQLIDDGVLLIGDAAGLAYTQSGEGIRPAIESGLMAADVIIRADYQYTKNRLSPYINSLTEHFGTKHNDDNGWLTARVKRWLTQQVLSNRYLSREILLNRYFLHRHVAPLPSQ